MVVVVLVDDDGGTLLVDDGGTLLVGGSCVGFDCCSSVGNGGDGANNTLHIPHNIFHYSV